MAFWSRFSSWFGGTVRVPGDQITQPTSGGYTTQNVTTETAHQLSSVFACLRLLAETISGLPFNFYQVSPDGTRKLLREHSLYRLFAFKPNRYQTRVEFWETVVWQLAAHGNAYILKQYNGKKLVALTPLMSTQVVPTLTANGSVTYTYAVGGKQQVFSSDDIWHVKLFGNGIIGMSPIDNARNSLGVAISAEERVSKIANNGFKPSGVLMIDKVLKPEQREALRKNFADLAEGGEDSLKILEAGMKYEQTSLSPKDVQFLESRRFQLEDICRFFGVPSVLVNDTSASTVWGSGIEQIIEGFYKFTIRPYLERIEASVIANLLTLEEYRTVEVEFDFDALFRSDTAKRFSAYKEGIQGGMLTPNEARQKEGLVPMPGGDKLFMQQQMTPIDLLGQSLGKVPNEPANSTAN